ncbi:MAG: class B sortase [Dorea sp.]|nr:class B sortase [Dorea sp.]
MKENKGKKYRRGRRKKGNLASNLILIIAAVIFCISAYQLFKIGKGYYDGRSEYNKVRDLVITHDNGEEFRVDFDELLRINPDTIGWIRFYPEPSIISYPIVQGEDNEEYLHKTFSANENTLGAIFLNVDNNADFSDKNSIIYGHRMKDGSMFRHLQDYEEKSFWQENPYFYIYTLDGRMLTYHIYSVGQVEDTSDTYLTSFASDEDYQAFLDLTKQTALYDTGVEVTTEDTIVTLSTCTSASDNHRFVVRGVKEEERVLEDDEE